MTLSVLSRKPHKIAALTAFDSTVAIATPSTLMWSTATKKRFRITFRTAGGRQRDQLEFRLAHAAEDRRLKVVEQDTGRPAR